jgi:hypothetical protein
LAGFSPLSLAYLGFISGLAVFSIFTRPPRIKHGKNMGKDGKMRGFGLDELIAGMGILKDVKKNRRLEITDSTGVGLAHNDVKKNRQVKTKEWIGGFLS